MLTRTDIKQYSTNFEELGSTVVILGSRGHSGIRKFALGSVSSRVVARSSAPSLVVREGVCATPEPPTPGGASSSTAEDRSVTICVGDDVNGRLLASWCSSNLLRPSDGVTLVLSKGPESAMSAVSSAVSGDAVLRARLRETESDLLFRQGAPPWRTSTGTSSRTS